MPGREGYFVVVPEQDLFDAGLRVLAILREQGKVAEIDYRQRSTRAQLRAADKGGFKYAWFVSPEPIVGRLRNLDNGAEFDSVLLKGE